VTVFRTILFSACFAGLVTGLAVTAVQQVGTVPLILKAEVYEQQQAATPSTHDHGAGDHGSGHEQVAGEPEAWSPADGIERNLYSAGANILTAVGFALLLAGAFVLIGRPVTWREGLLWGLGGFLAFNIAPSLGLPPELPGMPAADLLPRQLWWIGTAAATIGAIALLALGRSIPAAALAIALLVAPHLIGAPAAPEEATAVPHSLWHQFVVAVTITSLLFWTLLGGLTGALHQRFVRR
jgi:cobalt transporter subunit CbtA